MEDVYEVEPENIEALLASVGGEAWTALWEHPDGRRAVMEVGNKRSEKVAVVITAEHLRDMAARFAEMAENLEHEMLDDI